MNESKDIDVEKLGARLNHIRITPRKMGLIADAIRGKTVQQAYEYLSFSPRKKTSTVVLGVLANAMANGYFNIKDQKDRESTFVSEILVGCSTQIKRFIPRAKGSGSRLLKRTCNLKIRLDLMGFVYEAIKNHVHDENCQHHEHHSETNSEQAEHKQDVETTFFEVKSEDQK